MTELSDAKVATFAQAIYGSPVVGAARVDWDHYNAGEDRPGVCWGLKRCVGVDVIALRGSMSLRDWLRDLDMFADPFDDGDLGPVHPGFLAGIRETWSALRPLLEQPVVVTGHSLGAARATILTALMSLDGFRPLRRVVFGEPKPGFSKLAHIVNGAGRSYCATNHTARERDPVTMLPMSFPPEEYVHSGPLAFLAVEPEPELHAQLGLFALHDMRTYLHALA